MKGIILAGGSGTRLFPLTKGVSKQLMPIYDKPMIYYPLSVLMLAGIQEVLIISTPDDLPRFKQLLGDGSEIGMSFDYLEQPSPDGLAQAFILGRDFIGNDNVSLILGDNIFYGHGINQMLSKALVNAENNKVATVFGSHVQDPERYGVVDFDKSGRALSIEEKPKNPKSNYAVTGLYFYPNDVVEKAAEVLPSERGELEISSVNQMFLDEERLNVEIMGRGYAWLDTGTHENLIEAGNFISTLERRQGLKTACLEEIGYKNRWLSKNKLMQGIKLMGKNEYSDYLRNIVK